MTHSSGQLVGPALLARRPRSPHGVKFPPWPRQPAVPIAPTSPVVRRPRCPACGWCSGSPARSWCSRRSAGGLSGSLALLADAGHMLTDVGALALSLVTAWIAQRPADDSKTYGYLRWEILAALVNGAALFMIAGWVVVEAIQRIQHPEPIRTGLFLVVAAGGLLVNLLSLGMLHGTRAGSLNARGAYLHVMGDALGSVGALGGGGDHLANRLDAGGSDRLDRAVAADPGRRLAAAPGEHRHPAGRRAPPRGDGRRAAPDPRRPGRGRGARSPRVDRGERRRRHERPRRGARPGDPSRCAGRDSHRDGALGIGHVTMQLEVADECEEARTAAHGSGHRRRAPTTGMSTESRVTPSNARGHALRARPLLSFARRDSGLPNGRARGSCGGTRPSLYMRRGGPGVRASSVPTEGRAV